MSEHIYFDDDVEDVASRALLGDADVVEMQFKTHIDALNIHKDDVVHLAKQFGLAVYEKDSAL